MLDRSLAFGPETIETRPLGGAESAFTWLARALAARGHRVHARTVGSEASDDGRLDWQPFGTPVPGAVDMVLANRRWELFRAAPTGGRRVLWLHNPAEGLRRIVRRAALAWYRPVLVTTSAYHRSTIPRHLWGPTTAIIPLAPASLFSDAPELAAAPRPRALFTSNPVRGLDTLLQLWTARIHPAVPGAELHLFGGRQTYQAGTGRRAGHIMDTVLETARGLRAVGVVVHKPAARPALRQQLLGARALLYPGTKDETYCLAAAEAQAMGVPAVLGDIGCLRERVVDGVTGFLTRGEEEFADRAIQVLDDDALWLSLHRQCLARQRARTWDHVAAEFEALL